MAMKHGRQVAVPIHTDKHNGPHVAVVIDGVEMLRCTCGAGFSTAGRLGRHVQKWNSRHDLRGKKLIRG